MTKTLINPLSKIFLFLIIFALNTQYSSCKLKTLATNDSNDIITLPLTPKPTNIQRLSLLSTSSLLKKTLQSKPKSPTKQELQYNMNVYAGKVLIGNPPQEVEMVFDTGSSNIIVSSTYCDSSTCKEHKRFDPSQSSSNIPIQTLESDQYEVLTDDNGKDYINILFGTGNVKCYIGYEYICVGEGNLCSNSTLLLEAYEMSPIPFEHVKFDGIIGLSFTHLSISKESNLIEMLHRQKKIHKRIFSFYFNIDNLKNSAIAIGGIDNKFYTGEIKYVKVISKYYWEIKLQEVYYDDQLLIDCKEMSCSAIIDTGTSMITAPSDSFGLIDNKTKIAYNCDGYSNMKNIAFKINGEMYPVEPEFYIIKFTEDEQNKCINGFMKLDLPNEDDYHIFILGMPFLKKYYSIFDREKNRVGFALANHVQ